MRTPRGVAVYRNRTEEIKWFPLRLMPKASRSACFSHLPEEFDALHWHGETYDLPPGCIHLAASEGCEIQAFEHPSAPGLQFHLEITRQGMGELIRECGGDIGSGPFEQSEDELTAGETAQRDAIYTALCQILDAVATRVR